MAPGAQSVTDYVNGKVSSGGYSRGGMTLEERRLKMREGVARIRGSASPKPPILHRFGSFSSIDRPATSFEDHRTMYYKRGGDRWDTDTEQLDDSTIDGSDYAASRQYFARSPAPEESTEASEVSEITDDEDKYSVTASVKTEPVTHPTSYPLQSLNGALQGHGMNNWTNTSRTRIVNRGPSGSVSGNDYHARYFQQHNFRQGFTVGTSNAIPFHTRTSNSPSLRPRDISAPPLRTRTASPTIGERSGHSRANGHSADNIPKSATIEEDAEYDNPLEIAHARQVRMTHQHSYSNLSQCSGMSRASSVSDIRGMRSPSTRFRTKRSRIMGRSKRNRSGAQELDYTPTELASMTYQQLADESFDFNPKATQIKSVIDFPEDVTTLEEKCDHVRSLPEKETAGPQVEETKTPQEVFFASLSIDEYDEAGDHIVSQLSGLLDRLRKIRREKRRAAADFEEEVASREHTVTTKTESLQNELTRLRKSGQEALAAAASKT